MRGKEKAAILLIALGPEVGGNVLKEMRENEIEALTMQVFTTETVTEETRREVLADCYGMALAQGYLSNGGAAYAEEMLSKALGPEKASEIMARLHLLRPARGTSTSSRTPTRTSSSTSSRKSSPRPSP